MNYIKNEVTDILKERLEDYAFADEYACDLSRTLLETENMDGTATYSRFRAIEWIQENFGELGEIWDEMKFQGLEPANVFDEPEKFHVQVLLEVASRVMSQCQTIQDNWNEKIELTDDMIEILQFELGEQRDTKLY